MAAAKEAAAMVTIPLFNPETEPTSLEEFVRRVDDAQANLKLSEGEAAILAISRLTGFASRTIRPRLERDTDWKHPKAWKPPAGEEGGVKAVLIAYFGKESTDLNKIKQEFIECTQNLGEGIMRYELRVDDIVNKIEATFFTSGQMSRADPITLNDVTNALKTLIMSVGMRPKVRKAVEQHNPKTWKDIVKQAKTFEATTDGREEVANTMGNRKVAAIQKATTAAEGHAAAAVSKDTSNMLCSYCGIPKHDKEMCFRKKRDEERGYIRDRHPDYPIKSVKEKKKKGDKSWKKAAAMTSQEAPNQQQQSLTYQGQQGYQDNHSSSGNQGQTLHSNMSAIHAHMLAGGQQGGYAAPQLPAFWPGNGHGAGNQ